MKKQKENSHEGITWFEMGKQNVQAEKVYYMWFSPKQKTFTQLRFWLKVFLSLKVIPFLLLSHTTKCQSKSINEKSKRIVLTRQLQPSFFKLPIGYTQLHAKAKISGGDKPFPPRFLAYPFLSSMLQCSNGFQERCASHTQCSSRLCVSTILADIRQPSGSRQL